MWIFVVSDLTVCVDSRSVYYIFTLLFLRATDEKSEAITAGDVHNLQHDNEIIRDFATVGTMECSPWEPEPEVGQSPGNMGSMIGPIYTKHQHNSAIMLAILL